MLERRADGRLAALQGPAVHPYADRHAALLRRPGDSLHALPSAYVARIEAQGVRPGLDRRQRAAVVEVYVGDDGYRGRPPHLTEDSRRLRVRHGQPEQVAAPLGAAQKLREDGLRVVRIGGAHGLHAHRRAAPHRQATDLQRSCLSSCEHSPRCRACRCGSCSCASCRVLSEAP